MNGARLCQQVDSSTSRCPIYKVVYDTKSNLNAANLESELWLGGKKHHDLSGFHSIYLMPSLCYYDL